MNVLGRLRAVRPWPPALAASASGDRVALGAAAARLLEDPVLALAFDGVERSLTAAWRNTALGEAEAREAAYRELWALGAVKARLAGFLGDARMIEIEDARKAAAEAKEARRRSGAL